CLSTLENQQQRGNQALSDRLTATAEPTALEAALAMILLAPHIPMLFMGEEWGSTRPFPVFCDFKGGLAEAVRAGRRKEFSEAYDRFGDEIQDPLDEKTRQKAVLDWDAFSMAPEQQRPEQFARRLMLG